MSAFDALRYRLATLRRVLLDRDGWRAEVDEELALHAELAAQQRAAAGPAGGAPRPRDDARRAREALLDASGATAADELRQDLRFAARALRARPGFAAAAVLTVGLGVGASTAVYSAVDAALLRPLPFAAPDRLVRLALTVPPRGAEPRRDDVPWSYPKFAALRDADDARAAFADLALSGHQEFTLRAAEGAVRVRGELADAHYLPTLGVRPALGRNFAPDEDRRPGGPRVAIVGDAFWRRHLGGDPAAVGATLTLGGEPYTVVGVAPPGFRGLSGGADVWVSLLSRPADELGAADVHRYTLVARLRDGVAPERARAAAARLGRRVDAAYPNVDVPGERWGADAVPLDALRAAPAVRRSLGVLLAAAGLVLGIACVNVANLLLLRGAARRRELALRAALGAGRRRLVRQLLTESALLVGVGGALGVAVAWAGVRALRALAPGGALGGAPVEGLAAGVDAVRLDGRALAVAAALTAATALAAGLVPAVGAARLAVRDALHDGAAAARRRGRDLLVAAEVALAVVLLAGAGLLARSLDNLLRVRPGFDAAGVVTLRVGVPAADMAGGPAAWAALYARVLAGVAATPGVAHAALADCLPYGGADRGCSTVPVRLHDRAPARPGAEPLVGAHWVSPGWAPALGVPLRRGRLTADADADGAPKVVLVNEAAARAFWPGRDPVGRRLNVGVGPFWRDTATVAGVVGDVRYAGPDSLPRPEVYVPYAQAPRPEMLVVVRAAGDPRAVVGAVRRAIAAAAPAAPVADVRPLRERVVEATAAARFRTLLVGVFGAAALGLAAVGTYGVVAFAVAQRTREIGVRLALGAPAGAVAGGVVAGALRLAAGGIAAGVVLALAASGALRALLYGLAPTDPAAYAGAAALLAVAAAAASWVPARRAARVGPAEVLRQG